MTLELTTHEIRRVRDALTLWAIKWDGRDDEFAKELDAIEHKIWCQANGLEWIADDE